MLQTDFIKTFDIGIKAVIEDSRIVNYWELNTSTTYRYSQMC